MIYELREYAIKPGCLEEFVRFLDEELLPFQASKGVRVVGSFTVSGDSGRYVWIRAFADEKERERICQAVYGSPEWKERFGPRCEQLMEAQGIRVSILEPTPASQLQ
ncbi:NIPSNAP family containing protein [Methylacidimicrobium sp. AP8]|uniref:NIPSNAP family protein n=1 Tax=Methylacidimicrobium sp. AP8 TaxID=2730359 RepID=UPI0018C195B8|nr:NIPSNAP family protein [Methylacidimicrobium sp. AP8]CAB4243624.1 NIPSNAP family containing protein [Methylacidimicrobium sp. AP8]